MSFKYAICGILKSIRSERNLRFHCVIANLITIFALVYGISRLEWAILIVTMAAVISAELFNTAVEAAVDTATDEIKETAKLAKDAAAGAVLMAALAALVVGVFLFGDAKKIGAALVHIFTTPKILIPCLTLGVADILFLIFGGKNDKGI